MPSQPHCSGEMLHHQAGGRRLLIFPLPTDGEKLPFRHRLYAIGRKERTRGSAFAPRLEANWRLQGNVRSKAC